MKTLLNLYSEELRERPVLYGFNTLLIVIALVLASVLALIQWKQQQIEAQKQQVSALQVRHASLEAAVQQLESDLPSDASKKALDREISLLKQEVMARRHALSILEDMLEKPVNGYADTLVGLAQASGRGVWLTRIELGAPVADGQPADVRLVGRMHEGRQLPHYLDALSQAPILRGLRFNSFQVERPQSTDEQVVDTSIRFMLSTRSDASLEQDATP